LRVRRIETAQQGCQNEIILHKQSFKQNRLLISG
jgi:hypothetical protein